MIALIVEQRCNACNLCVDVCPANVFDRLEARPPIIARQTDCTTCFMCELYCRQDALYVAPDCEAPTQVDVASVLASGQLGRYRRDAGWDEWQGIYPNEQYLMERVFRRARAPGGSDDRPFPPVSTPRAE
jgi:NAD-dependent dihydropyrimidine dehydrogenase PreA subunit